MGSNSSIEWTTHTFNPWRGCTKVSPGCANCYAEAQARRNPKVLGVWGDAGTRVIGSEAYWHLPREWDLAAAEAGGRARVFCASLADWLEDRPDLVAPRARLLSLVRLTPHLDWLLLTKRPELLWPAIEHVYRTTADEPLAAWLADWMTERDVPPHVWLGASAEDQQRLDERSQAICTFPAAVRFLSVEPMLGRLDFTAAFRRVSLQYNGQNGQGQHTAVVTEVPPLIHWVIVGGESGPRARPMHPDWVRSARRQCERFGVAFFFKQWGEWLPYDRDAQPPFWSCAADGHVIDRHSLPEGLSDGKVQDRWLADFDLEETLVVYHRVGKKAAGRLLDGRTWDEFPAPAKMAQA